MVNWLKQILDPSITTDSIFAGDALNYLIDYFKGVDLTGGNPLYIAKIGHETRWANGKFRLWDSNMTHTVRFETPDFTEDKIMKVPSTLGPLDTISFSTNVEEFKNKIINLSNNTLLNLPSNSGIATAGTYVADGGGTVFNIPHLTSPIPDFVSVEPASNHAKGDFYITIGATNITVTYASATTLGSDNISLHWFAGYAGTHVGFGGLPAGGNASIPSNGVLTSFTIPHTLTPTPHTYYVFPTTADARGDYIISIDATNIIITYPMAPPTGTLGFVWGAGYVGTAQGFTKDSITTFTNKTIGDYLKFKRQASPPPDPAADEAVIWMDDVDSNNDSIYIKYKEQGAFVTRRLF